MHANLTKHVEVERAYWLSVLKCVAETVIFLAERGFAFRGSDEVIGSPYNGNVRYVYSD